MTISHNEFSPLDPHERAGFGDPHFDGDREFHAAPPSDEDEDELDDDDLEDDDDDLEDDDLDDDDLDDDDLDDDDLEEDDLEEDEDV